MVKRQMRPATYNRGLDRVVGVIQTIKTTESQDSDPKDRGYCSKS